MTRWVIGDIHGNHNALIQCFQRCKFNYEKDVLISLGDVCDGFHQTKQVIDELLKIKKFILCAGNHDRSNEGCGNVKYGWALGWMLHGEEIPLWWNQGGIWTAKSYDFDRRNVPRSHIDLLMNALPYYVDEFNNLFVHGGFDERYPISEQDPEDIMWNRDLVYQQMRKGAKPIEGYNKVFFGHTSTQAIMDDWDATLPLINNNCIALDTGGGWNGKVTIMNVETLEYWQSDLQKPE